MKKLLLVIIIGILIILSNSAVKANNRFSTHVIDIQDAHDKFVVIDDNDKNITCYYIDNLGPPYLNCIKTK